MEIVAKTIKDAWPEVLRKIITDGISVKIQVDGCQMIDTVELPEPLNVMIKTPNVDMIPEGSKWSSGPALDKYVVQVLNAENTGHEYTYGERLRKFEYLESPVKDCKFEDMFINEFDQIEEIITKALCDTNSRQNVASLWRVGEDNFSIHPPCIMVIQVVIRKGKSNLNAYIRSNDMFGAVPENWYLLAKLNESIANVLDLEPGFIYTTSRCAHIYGTDVLDASRIVGLEDIGYRWMDEFKKISVSCRVAVP
jgi:thymidylate synthase (methanogen type)